MPDYSGLSIGRYHIIEPLGQGGMATVYRAFDTRLDCDVAIKFIRMERLTGEEKEKALKRFEREAKELARLTHPNIVKVTDFGKYRGTPYLVMEYLSGGTIKESAHKPLSYDQAARLLAPVARALEYAHEENLIHRDIKPGNILLTSRGQPMLSDFGIAKILDVEGGNTLTSTNVAIGTPEYMAPEQWLNQVSAQSDIYSLGVVFYELVTGRKPFTADTPAAVFLKQTNDPLPRPRSFMPGLPEEVEQALYKALAKKPEERYAGMGAFAAALEGLSSPAKTVQPPKLEVIEGVSVHPQVRAGVPKPAAREDLQSQETGPARPVSPSPGADRALPAREGFIPVSLPAKKAPGKSRTSRGGWVFVGIIALTGVIALAGWGYSKFASGQAITQTAQALAALPPTGTPARPTSTPTLTETPTATATITMTPTPTLEIGSTQISPKDGMVQMYVPAGEFLMGSDTVKESQSYSEELPQHTVYLDGFWIDRTEITNAQYASCVAEGHCTLPGNTISSRHSSYYGDVQYADYPVVYVNWNQSQAYCAWAGRRLSSEAEWEKAARGTDGRLYPWGNAAPDQNRLNYNVDKGDTTAVGSYIFGASPYGALNMAGNVWEWVNDWYSSTYYQNSQARNPLGPDSGTDRGLRGGSWNNSDRYIRSAQRYSNIPTYWYYDVGFRCAASIVASPVTSITAAPASAETQALTPMPALKIGPTQISPKDSMVQMYVPAGEFSMGSVKAQNFSQGYDNELPKHTVYLDSFWVDQTEVTNAMYAHCVASGQCAKPYDTKSYSRTSYYGDSRFDNYPVIYVDWNQAQAYCRWAGRRLPSEAEWEKAARGTDWRIYPWGNAALIQSLLNYNNNQGDTTAVGSYPSGASPYGALDMAGNVWEWVNDWYYDIYYQLSPARNPAGPNSGTSRVLRGGSWSDYSWYARSAMRNWDTPISRNNNIGFRCVAGTAR